MKRKSSRYLFLSYCANRYLLRNKPIIIGIVGNKDGDEDCLIYQTLKYFFNHKNFHYGDTRGEVGLLCGILGIRNKQKSLFTSFKIYCKSIWLAFFGRKNYDAIILNYGILDDLNDLNYLKNILRPDILILSEDANCTANTLKIISNTKNLTFVDIENPHYQNIIPYIKVDQLTYKSGTIYESIPDIYCDYTQQTKKIKGKNQSKFQYTFILHIKSQSITINTNVSNKQYHSYIGIAICITEILAFQRKEDINLNLNTNSELSLAYK